MGPCHFLWIDSVGNRVPIDPLTWCRYRARGRRRQTRRRLAHPRPRRLRRLRVRRLPTPAVPPPLPLRAPSHWRGTRSLNRTWRAIGSMSGRNRAGTSRPSKSALPQPTDTMGCRPACRTTSPSAPSIGTAMKAGDRAKSRTPRPQSQPFVATSSAGNSSAETDSRPGHSPIPRSLHPQFGRHPRSLRGGNSVRDSVRRSPIVHVWLAQRKHRRRGSCLGRCANGRRKGAHRASQAGPMTLRTDEILPAGLPHDQT